MSRHPNLGAELLRVAHDACSITRCKCGWGASVHAADMNTDAGGAGGGAGDSFIDMEPDMPSSLEQTSFGACFWYCASLQEKPVWCVCSEVYEVAEELQTRLFTC